MQKNDLLRKDDKILRVLEIKHETVQYEEHLPEVLEAPVCRGDIAGTVDIYISGEFYDSVVVYIGGDVARINYPYVFRKLVREYFLLST